MHPPVIERVLWAAHDMGAATALFAAVDVTSPDSGQLGFHAVPWGGPRRLTFDLLASLANIPGARGEVVRSALLYLSGYLETAGPAVVRLPGHLLTMGQRADLNRHLQAFEAFFGAGPCSTAAGASA